MKISRGLLSNFLSANIYSKIYSPMDHTYLMELEYALCKINKDFTN